MASGGDAAFKMQQKFLENSYEKLLQIKKYVHCTPEALIVLNSSTVDLVLKNVLSKKSVTIIPAYKTAFGSLLSARL